MKAKQSNLRSVISKAIAALAIGLLAVAGFSAEETPGTAVPVENLQVQEHLQGLYEYLVGNRFIRPIDDYNEDYLSIFSRAALVKLRAGDPEWEAMVPERVAAIIKERGLLGLKLLAT